MVKPALAWSLFKAVRPRQWLKNLAVFTPIIFTGQLFHPLLFWVSVKAFLVFCTISSANYLFNDIMDAPHDRRHPFKRLRPIASGALPISMAATISAILLLIGLWISYRVSTGFFAMTALFALLAYTYTLLFKHVAVVDILVIALAYFLRVYAGEAATG